MDCPLTAAYMDVTTLYKGMAAPVVHKNAICVFESDESERRGRRGFGLLGAVAAGGVWRGFDPGAGCTTGGGARPLRRVCVLHPCRHQHHASEEQRGGAEG